MEVDTKGHLKEIQSNMWTVFTG